MDLRPVTDEITVAPQFKPEEMAAVAEAGYKTVICNRPDGEEALQPTWAEMAAAGEAAGLQTHHLPIISGQLTAEAVDAFGKIVAEAPKPVLAYCRSGTRSIMMWALSRKGDPGRFEVLKLAEKAGYDLSGIADRL